MNLHAHKLRIDRSGRQLYKPAVRRCCVVSHRRRADAAPLLRCRAAAGNGNSADGASAAAAAALWDDAAAAGPREQRLDGAASSSCDGGGGATTSLGASNPASLWLPPAMRGKVIVALRHGASTWNEQGRVQGDTDISELTAVGVAQARAARAALSDIAFDACYSSPHTRARQTAAIVADAPVFLDSLREADLGWFQGRTNADIAAKAPDLYRTWREAPEDFCLDGRYPVRDAFDRAARAWDDVLSSPANTILLVTHKSMLRAMLCTAMGLPPAKFRALDISNGAVCILRSHARGLSLSALNLTAHLASPEVRYALPKVSSNDGLAAGAAAAGAAAVRGAARGAATR